MRSVTVTELDTDGVGSQVKKNGTSTDQWGRRHSEEHGPKLKKMRADGVGVAGEAGQACFAANGAPLTYFRQK